MKTVAFLGQALVFLLIAIVCPQVEASREKAKSLWMSNLNWNRNFITMTRQEIRMFSEKLVRELEKNFYYDKKGHLCRTGILTKLSLPRATAQQFPIPFEPWVKTFPIPFFAYDLQNNQKSIKEQRFWDLIWSWWKK